jgi:hypothetical protein
MSKVDSTSEPAQDQPTAALAATACPLISDQITGLGSYTTSNDYNKKFFNWLRIINIDQEFRIKKCL